MATISDFSGPEPDVFTNVCALNTVYLDAITDMKGPQKGRLSAAPFLLFSIRETNVDWWRDCLQVDPQIDLLDDSSPLSADMYALQTAAIGFLWQLARNNAYAARIVSGANIAWCEWLIDWPLVTLLERVGRRTDLLQARVDLTHGAQDRMLTLGAGSRSAGRRAAHIAELQSMITLGSKTDYPRMKAAACTMPSVAMNVAEARVTEPPMKVKKL